MKLDVTRPAYVIGFCAAFAGIFTALVMALQLAAAGRIQENERLRDQRALVKVFELAPDGKSFTTAEIDRIVKEQVDDTLMVKDPLTGREFKVYRAWEGPKGAGAPKAIAIPIGGTGFWAPIAGLLAMTPDLSHSLRAVFTEQKETPGLGGRIEEEAFQRDQFRGLNVTPVGDGKPFLYVASERPKAESDPRYGRTVEAITGATQTSRAVVRFVNADLAAFHRAWQAQGTPTGKGAPHE